MRNMYSIYIFHDKTLSEESFNVQQKIELKDIIQKKNRNK